MMVIAAAPALAQAPLPADAFEVASIKRNLSGAPVGGIQPQPGGHFNAVNVPLRQLIQLAYRIPPFQLTGGPEWLATDRFDVIAKADGELNPNRTPLLLRRLLEERLGLRVRTETRELPIFHLRAATTDGRLGPNLRPSTATCGVTPVEGLRDSRPAGPPICAVRVRGGYITGTGQAIAELALPLTRHLQRVVVDRTGLSGNFDFELTWTPGPAGPAIAGEASSASLYTALQEQLGLRLEAARGPVDVVVIEQVQPPSGD